MSGMKVTVKPGKGSKGTLVIEIPCEMKPSKVSPSGKTIEVASTRGNKEVEGVEVDGKPLIIGLNAYVRNPDHHGKKKGGE